MLFNSQFAAEQRKPFTTNKIGNALPGILGGGKVGSLLSSFSGLRDTFQHPSPKTPVVCKAIVTDRVNTLNPGRNSLLVFLGKNYPMTSSVIQNCHSSIKAFLQYEIPGSREVELLYCWIILIVREQFDDTEKFSCER